MGWETRRLGDIAKVTAGNSAPQDASLFEDGKFPFFRTSDVGRIHFGRISEPSDYLNNLGIRGLRQFPVGSILFPKSGASTFLNHRVMLGAPGYVSSHLAAIIADEKLADSRYLLYYLATVRAQDLVQDHAYPSLNLPLIENIPVPLPPLAEQKRIVAKLDEAFAAIDVAKSNAKRNLQNALALFESHLDTVFSQRGEGWVENKLGELAQINYGHTESASWSEIGPRFLRITDIQDGKVEWSEVPYCKIARSDIPKYQAVSSSKCNGLTVDDSRNDLEWLHVA